jgi:uncharacterized protein (DUF2141 family)
MVSLKNLFTATLIMWLCACAQIVAPGGGPKDTRSPRVLKYMPDSASVNIKPSAIFVVFDEYINLKGLENQLIISPPLEKSPDIKVKDKTLMINLSKEDTLKNNTTYVFSFGNAIQDNNENNPKEDFKYVFSTGNFIDSLTIKGKVENAFDHKTEKDILVMLYHHYDDSTIYKSKPDYFTKTKEDGTFKMTNVRDGKYKMIALKDVNANYKYDGDDEKIAFIDSLITVPSSVDLLLEMFQEPPPKFYLKKRIYNSYGKIDFYFNKGADSITIKPTNFVFNDGDVMYDYTTNKDTLTYWFRNIDVDSLFLEVINGNKVLDTIKLKLIKKEDALKDKKKPLKLTLLNSPDNNTGFDLGAELNLVFSNQIMSYDDTKKISLKEDSLEWQQKSKSLSYCTHESTVTLCICCDNSIRIEDPNNSGVFVIAPTKSTVINWKANTNYHLFIPPATFTDFFGFTNDSIHIHFKTKEETYYGSLKMQINLYKKEHGYLVQLLDEQDKVVRENTLKSSEIITYEHLSPAKYKLKIIYDSNNNYRWDSGNISKKQQPEKVIYNSEVINVRSNWDLDLKLDVK